MTVLDVGGAYAHKFFDFLDFLELPTLIITDIDSVDQQRKACPVHKGRATSNACIKEWFSADDCSLATLLEKGSSSKIKELRRIAYQQPERIDGPCGRTLEDAFMLANPTLFDIDGISAENAALSAWDKSKDFKKSGFALQYAIDQTDWISPRYILDGLRWLASDVGTKNETIGGTGTKLPDDSMAKDGNED